MAEFAILRPRWLRFAALVPAVASKSLRRVTMIGIHPDDAEAFVAALAQARQRIGGGLP